MDTQNVRILRFSILAKILGYHLKSPKSRFSPALKSDFLLEGWAEFLQGVFLGTKEALCKISAKSSNKKLENWHPKNHDFRTFSKMAQNGPSVKISKNAGFCCDFDFLCPKSSLVADFDPFMSTWKHFLCEKAILADFHHKNLQTTLLAGFWVWIHCRRPNFKFLRNASRST